MKLKWRSKQDIGKIKIKDNDVLEMLKNIDQEPLCLAPRLLITRDKNGKIIHTEIIAMSLIPFRYHRKAPELNYIIGYKDEM